MAKSNGPLRVVTVVGARPQFIKAAALSARVGKLSRGLIEERIIHTGQHFDSNMSDIFFEDLGIPRPSHQLRRANGSHGAITGAMMAQLDPLLESEMPDLVLVYGDTNSTIAAALSAVKLGIPVAHVEAGMRSGNMSMPEEINRVVTDRVSALNLAPSELAMTNLHNEGLGQTGRLVGDIMFDAVKLFSSRATLSQKTERLIPKYSTGAPFVLATFHRQENTESDEKLREIWSGVLELSTKVPIVLPMHPRLRQRLGDLGLLKTQSSGLIILPPLSYVEMISLQRNALTVVTDSGGIQKEAFYLQTPCVTVRDQTEWPETVALGWNRLAPADSKEIVELALSSIGSFGVPGNPYGEGESAKQIIDLLLGRSWQNFF